MRALILLAISLLGMSEAYLIGQAHPDEHLLARAKAEAYAAGREAVLADLPSPKKATAEICIAWWTQSDLRSAKRRLCGK